MVIFDQVWIENRFRYRRRMTGTALRLDPVTGYLEPMTKRGFSADSKRVFIERWKVCNNQRQIAKSVGITIQSFYDALALDDKFRQDFLKYTGIPGRSKRLNDELVKLAASEKSQVITALTKKTDLYRS